VLSASAPSYTISTLPQLEWLKQDRFACLIVTGSLSADGRRLFRLVAYDGVEGFFTLPLSRCVGSPNSKPPLVVAGRAIIDADIRVTSSWELVQACDLHFLPAATCGQFGATGYQ
jgi:hypothetical protein